MNRKAIFKYMGWEEIMKFPLLNLPCINIHPLDANDMIAVVNKMVEKEDWNLFLFISAEKFLNEKKAELLNLKPFIPWLMQPSRFFELISEWLEGK